MIPFNLQKTKKHLFPNKKTEFLELKYFPKVTEPGARLVI